MNYSAPLMSKNPHNYSLEFTIKSHWLIDNLEKNTYVMYDNLLDGTYRSINFMHELDYLAYILKFKP